MESETNKADAGGDVNEDKDGAGVFSAQCCRRWQEAGTAALIHS